ncbi:MULTISPECIES: hypothetical protein [unclassified Shinella]|uniref:hypothetical protein n=1 Tax=unclassified Shinella TaxID=2643062 RepID=UPI00225D49AE|nr:MULTISPECIES: hypothetical protein [unclassified Shinella]MCO5140852.1 hypothetical protein [Shinella sp.]MDC7256459.1 hypothetical protein [Shinella sp. YE25]CAI0339326.1 hypothetical protein SHINE37_43180 [Rhizobiaceae bacterium]
MLTDLIEAHLAATAEFRITDEGHINEEGIWDRKEEAELAVMRCPCRTIEDVRAKARWALADDVVQDSIRNCHIDQERILMIFLRSLLGEAPVDKSNNGEN